MKSHGVIVIGASAGGIEALVQIVRELPDALPAALFALIHIPAWAAYTGSPSASTWRGACSPTPRR